MTIASATSKEIERDDRFWIIVTAIALWLLPFFFFGCGYTAQTPSSANEVTHRHNHPEAVVGHRIYPDTMTRFYDTPPNIWYDLDHNPWRYDENGWTKLEPAPKGAN